MFAAKPGWGSWESVRIDWSEPKKDIVDRMNVLGSAESHDEFSFFEFGVCVCLPDVSLCHNSLNQFTLQRPCIQDSLGLFGQVRIGKATCHTDCECQSILHTSLLVCRWGYDNEESRHWNFVKNINCLFCSFEDWEWIDAEYLRWRSPYGLDEAAHCSVFARTADQLF